MQRHLPRGSPRYPHGHNRVAFLPGVRVTLKALRPTEFPNGPETIGEHLKARRLALGLYQRQAAERLGVTLETVLHWEKNRTEPPASVYPAIIAFLGYDPSPTPGSLSERIKAKRRALGWTIREAARQLDVDPTAWGSWEHGGLILHREHRARVAGFLGIPAGEVEEQMARAWGEKHVRAADTRSP